MKQFVTLVVVVALLGALTVSASADMEDTLILKATVEPYAAVWFANDGITPDGHNDMDAEKALNFTIDADAIAAAMGLGLGDEQTVEDFAISQSTTLQARTNYGVNLGIMAQAPKHPTKNAVLRTEIKVDDLRFVGGTQDGDQYDDFGTLTTADLCPTGTTTTEVNLLGRISYGHISGIEMSGWNDAGYSIPFTVSVFPQNYRYDNDPGGYVEDQYTPALASDGYEGYIKATISAATP